MEHCRLLDGILLPSDPYYIGRSQIVVYLVDGLCVHKITFMLSCSAMVSLADYGFVTVRRTDTVRLISVH